eukprot:5904443-Pleurochrysis_carterae.AAC.2
MSSRCRRHSGRPAREGLQYIYLHFVANDASGLRGVRAGASQRLDVLWREFFALGRTSTANKANYVPMAIMRIFWSDALDSKLADLYHSMRSIPMSFRKGSMVG